MKSMAVYGKQIDTHSPQFQFGVMFFVLCVVLCCLVRSDRFDMQLIEYGIKNPTIFLGALFDVYVRIKTHCIHVSLTEFAVFFPRFLFLSIGVGAVVVSVHTVKLNMNCN